MGPCARVQDGDDIKKVDISYLSCYQPLGTNDYDLEPLSHLSSIFQVHVSFLQELKADMPSKAGRGVLPCRNQASQLSALLSSPACASWVSSCSPLPSFSAVAFVHFPVLGTFALVPQASPSSVDFPRLREFDFTLGVVSAVGDLQNPVSIINPYCTQEIRTSF